MNPITHGTRVQFRLFVPAKGGNGKIEEIHGIALGEEHNGHIWILADKTEKNHRIQSVAVQRESVEAPK